MMSRLSLPRRTGAKPNTTSRTPHSQLDQNASPEVFAKLTGWMFAQANVREEESQISVPGARAMILDETIDAYSDAFMVGREFAHVHPDPLPGSLHLKLDEDDVREVIEKGWGENHFLVDAGRLPVGTVMIFAPRDDDDLDVITTIIRKSMAYASHGLALCGCDHH